MARLAFENQRVDKRPFITLDDNAVGHTGQALREHFEEDRKIRLQGTVVGFERALLFQGKLRIRLLGRLRSNWDSYDAPAPNDASLANAVRILDLLQPYEVNLLRVLPSAEGGIGLCFVNNDRYADIECSNNGEIIGVRYIGQQPPSLIEIDGSDASIQSALTEIRNHISA